MYTLRQAIKISSISSFLTMLEILYFLAPSLSLLYPFYPNIVRRVTKEKLYMCKYWLYWNYLYRTNHWKKLKFELCQSIWSFNSTRWLFIPRLDKLRLFSCWLDGLESHRHDTAWPKNPNFKKFWSLFTRFINSSLYFWV